MEMLRSKIVVSSAIPVYAGDRILQKAEGGYGRTEAPCDGIYLGPDFPIMPFDEIEPMIKEIARHRRAEAKRTKRLVEVIKAAVQNQEPEQIENNIHYLATCAG